MAPSLRSRKEIPIYKDLFVNARHNDYPQALVGTGVVRSACIVSFIAVLDHQVFKQITNWPYDWDGPLRVAALTGRTGLPVHSAFDFNLQTPANGGFFASCAVSRNFSAPWNEKPCARRSVISFRTQDSLEPSEAGE